MFISFRLTLKVKSIASAPHRQHGGALGEGGGGGLWLLQPAAWPEGLAAGGHFCTARGRELGGGSDRRAPVSCSMIMNSLT